MAKTVDITKEPFLEELVKTGSIKMLKKYGRKILFSPMLRELFDENPEKEVLLFLAQYSNSPSAILEKMSVKTTDTDVLAALVRHPRLPQNILQKIIQEASFYVRISACFNPSITPETAKTLVKDKHFFVRALIAGHKKLFRRLEYYLSFDKSELVKTVLASRIKLNQETFDNLIVDESIWIKATLVFYVKSPEILFFIAEIDDLAFQSFLLTNKKCPEKVLERLSFSSHQEIVKGAIKKKNLTIDEFIGWAENKNEEIRIIVSSKQKLPDSVQKILLKDSSAKVRQELALNISINEMTALLLYADKDPAVTTALALNKNLSEKMIAHLCKHPDSKVKKAITLRNDLTEKHLEILLNENREYDIIYHLAVNKQYCKNICPEVAKKLSSHKLPTLREYYKKSN
ncbi:MAG: hypothetical protein U9O87_08120 [Verrucomicrobiota bacterium]|nr:hypothetical protein [Verrucomicrobiota bacterium]